MAKLWTLKKFSEPRVSLNDGAKDVENGESWTYLQRGRHRVDSVCAVSSVEMTILPPNALIDPDLCTLVPHLKVEVNGP